MITTQNQSMANSPPRHVPYGEQFSASGTHLIRVNASSFARFKTCPRKYQLEVLSGEGKGEDDPDLRFGTLLHAAKALYETNKARGASHDLALQGAFRFLLHETWNDELGKPNFTTHPVKNRATLLRTFVWYVDQYRDDPCETLILAGGTPAVELQFEFDTGLVSPEGDPVTFVGTLDRLVRFNGRVYITDIKTSTSARWLNAGNYSPDFQFSLYCVAGRVCFGEEVAGIILDGMDEVSQGGSPAERGGPDEVALGAGLLAPKALGERREGGVPPERHRVRALRGV